MHGQGLSVHLSGIRARHGCQLQGHYLEGTASGRTPATLDSIEVRNEIRDREPVPLEAFICAEEKWPCRPHGSCENGLLCLLLCDLRRPWLDSGLDVSGLFSFLSRLKSKGSHRLRKEEITLQSTAVVQFKGHAARKDSRPQDESV